MFDELTDKLEGVFKKLRGHGKLTEGNIKDAMKEVRLALLEADVNYRVVKRFIKDVTEKSLGAEVLQSISPGQQIIKIVHDQLVEVLGGEAEEMTIASSPPTKIVLVGLQGSGKTTMCGKLAKFYRKKNKSPLLVAADIYRPAAVDQLKTLGKNIDIPVFHIDKDPPKISKKALDFAYDKNNDVVIIDTAGRLHIDDALMEELEKIRQNVEPHEILLIADAMTGQDAVNIAQEFNQRLDLTGVILTKMDGDARGGAALSIKSVTGKPIKLVGTGEKMDDIEVFHPDRMASRILGMGDVVSLVEKAQETIDTKEAEKLEKKLRKEAFTLEDFYSQMQQLKKMGPLESLVSMLPGVGGALKGLKIDDSAMGKVEAIIQSMTPEERTKPDIIDGSRRRRIAEGSGNSVADVNRLLKQFNMMQKMIKKISRGQMKDFAKGLFS
ncbi:MAG: signal recognition particle protein [candidate division Zixibacteria bacterium]|nr:signal recognition particle protein [candidate division Zixibacteria bacterium]NIR64230.1 signal recognition particle protein [candidate division Zixibacteria bacterium]NIS15796.1 signal recognition particle protein [candidate division Zixibacteria bacterium]NIS46130.1 signal recognition particle protein [candidate division Zixibacteria bacterium]NIT52277.1 signal recognition particle protein [candidate division Zixibacteria bacterium]